MLFLQFPEKLIAKTEKDLKKEAGIARRGMARALNRTMVTGRKLAIAEIQKDLLLKTAPFRKQLNIVRATPKNLVVKIRAKRASTPAIAYKGVRQNKRGVTVKYRKSKPRLLHKGAFIATVKSGHKGVFRRKGKKRFPIQEILGPNTIAIFEQVVPAVEKQLYPVLNKNITHDVNFLRNKSKGRI